MYSDVVYLSTLHLNFTDVLPDISSVTFTGSIRVITSTDVGRTITSSGLSSYITPFKFSMLDSSLSFFLKSHFDNSSQYGLVSLQYTLDISLQNHNALSSLSYYLFHNTCDNLSLNLCSLAFLF